MLKNLTINLENSLLILILLLSLILRTRDLSLVPVELHPDEIANIVSAKSIIEEGKDLNSKISPYFYYTVQMHPPLYGYTAYIFRIFLNDSAFALRLPAAIFGTVAIYLLFLFTKKLTSNYAISLLSALILAILPWHIHFSRVGYEPSTLLPFFLLSVYFVIKASDSKKLKDFLLGNLFAGLTFYTYLSGSFYILVILGVIFLFNVNFLKNRGFWLSSLLFIIIVLPFFIWVYPDPQYYLRNQNISTFKIGITNESINIFLFNFTQHFTFDFLFKSGDPNLRHGSGHGVLYYWMLPFLIAGSITIKKYLTKSWYFFLLLIWVLIYPLGGSLTNDGVPHATRTLIGAPLFSIISAVGVYYFFETIKTYKKSKLFSLFSLFLVIVISLSLFLYLKKYFLEYPKISGAWWQYGNKAIFETINKLEIKGYKTACLDNLDYWNRETLLYYYLKNTKMKIITGTDDPSCSSINTILVKRFDRQIYPDAKLKFTILDINRNPIYKIYTID